MGVVAEGEVRDAGGRYGSNVLGVCHWIPVRLWLVCHEENAEVCPVVLHPGNLILFLC